MRKNQKNFMHIISAKKSERFIKEFNETVIPEDFISSCKSVGLLFNRQADNYKENEESHMNKKDKENKLAYDFREYAFYVFLDALKIFIYTMTIIIYMSLLMADICCVLFLFGVLHGVNFIIIIPACLILIFILAVIISICNYAADIAIATYESCENFFRKKYNLRTFKRLRRLNKR